MLAAKNIKNNFEENNYGKLTVLIADEESMNVSSLSNLLYHAGFIVHVINTIDNLERTLNLEKIDIVIMEYSFKKKRGVKEFRNVKIKSKNSKV